MEIRKCTKEEIKQLYQDHMVHDFLPEELKPLFRIFQLLRRGIYQCRIIMEQRQLIGYAFTVEHDGIILLDYFAIHPMLRGQGWGHKVLKGLLEELECDLFILEVETVEFAKTEQERHQNQRRIDFYKTCGLQMTGLQIHFFDVDYSIMVKPTSLSSAQIQEKCDRLYSTMLPQFVKKRELQWL